MEKISKILEKLSKEKSVYYRRIEPPYDYHYDIMESRGAEIVYGSLPSFSSEGDLNYYAMGIIPIEKTHFITSWEIEKTPMDITIRGSNNDGDQVAIFIFPQGSPIGVLFGGVEVSPEDFETFLGID